MNRPVQIITSPTGERMVVLPEADYALLLAAAEDDEGEVQDGFAAELKRRSAEVAKGRFVERPKRG